MAPCPRVKNFWAEDYISVQVLCRERQRFINQISDLYKNVIMKLSSLLSLGLSALAVGTSLPKYCISDADVGTYVGAFQQVLSKSNGYAITAAVAQHG